MSELKTASRCFSALTSCSVFGFRFDGACYTSSFMLRNDLME
jgi:hypothetical protein